MSGVIQVGTSSVLVFDVSAFRFEVSGEAVWPAVVLKPGGCLRRGGVEFFEEIGFFLRSIANGGFKHVEKLVLFVAHAMPVKHPRAAGGDDDGQIVDGLDGLPSLGVDVFVLMLCLS